MSCKECSNQNYCSNCPVSKYRPIDVSSLDESSRAKLNRELVKSNYASDFYREQANICAKTAFDADLKVLVKGELNRIPRPEGEELSDYFKHLFNLKEQLFEL